MATSVAFAECTRVAVNLPMPRKQRFKPSRKPKQEQATVSNPQVDDRKEFHPSEAQDVERQAPVEQAPRDIESERG
jgi:hypothetical protein